MNPLLPHTILPNRQIDEFSAEYIVLLKRTERTLSKMYITVKDNRKHTRMSVTTPEKLTALSNSQHKALLHAVRQFHLSRCDGPWFKPESLSATPDTRTYKVLTSGDDSLGKPPTFDHTYSIQGRSPAIRVSPNPDAAEAKSDFTTLCHLTAAIAKLHEARTR